MTVRDVGDLTIYLGAVAGALAALAVVFRFAVLNPLDKRIDRKITQPLAKANKQLAPNGGVTSENPTTHDYAKAAAEEAKLAREKANEALTQIGRVAERAAAADRVAELQVRRLDDHLKGHL